MTNRESMAGPQPDAARPAYLSDGRSTVSLPFWVKGIDAVLSVQRPVVVSHIRSIRRAHPDASTDRLIRALERRYLGAVTIGGAAVGVTAAVPAVGTGVSLALAGAETLGFLESSALFAQSVSEVHGIAVSDPERARALVITMMLGNSGAQLLRQFSGEVLHTAAPRPAFWGEFVTTSLPQFAVGPVADELKKRFVKRFAASQGTTLLGKAIPFGIGAAIGGVGNHIAGRDVVASARRAFGPPPLMLNPELSPPLRANAE